MADRAVDELEAQPRPARIGSPANLLGLARSLATPVVVALMLIGSPGLGIVALVLFCAAAFTDFLDGWVARARGEVSPLGGFLDLTADPALPRGARSRPGRGAS